MLKRVLKLMSLAMIVVMAFGCTKEDTSFCNPGVRMQFYYLLNSKYKNLFGEEVNKISVYVFDKDSIYLETYSDEGDKLTDDFAMELPLKAGKYNVVALGGDMSTYKVGGVVEGQSSVFKEGLVKGVTRLRDFRFLIDDPTNLKKAVKNGVSGDYYVVDEIVDDLYYGNNTDLTVNAVQITPVSVGLVKNTHIVKMIVTGLDNLKSAQARRLVKTTQNPLDIYCTARNGRYGWENFPDKNGFNIKYMPYEVTVTAHSIEANMRVLRLVMGEPFALNVVNPLDNRKLLDKDMVTMIMLNPKYKLQEDLDREDEFIFTLNIDPDYTITLSVNGWEIMEVLPEL